MTLAWWWWTWTLTERWSVNVTFTVSDAVECRIILQDEWIYSTSPCQRADESAWVRIDYYLDDPRIIFLAAWVKGSLWRDSLFDHRAAGDPTTCRKAYWSIINLSCCDWGLIWEHCGEVPLITCQLGIPGLVAKLTGLSIKGRHVTQDYFFKV